MIAKNPKISAPFKKLTEFQDDLFLSTHLPDGFSFPDDPSHLKTNDARHFLEFIRKRQRDVPNDIFAFQYWLDGKNELQDPAESDDEDSSETTQGQGSRQEMPKPKGIPRTEGRGQDDPDRDQSDADQEDEVESDSAIRKGKRKEVRSPSEPYSDWSESEEEVGDLPQRGVSFEAGELTQGML